MRAREFAVLGLGEFGYSIAKTLAEQGCQVLAADMDEERVNSIAPLVTQAVQADLTDPAVLDELGLDGLDGVAVALANNLEASIMATMAAKESGVPYVLVRAQNELHEAVLRKLGADEVILPERSMGVRVARSLVAGRFVDMAELTANVSMAELTVPEEWAGKTLSGLALRQKGLNVIARAEKNGEVVTRLDPEKPLKAGDIYIIVGETDALSHLLSE